MKVDSGLCQPAGTPIFVQTGRRLGVTFSTVTVYIHTDVLRPIHISVKRIIVFLAHVQTKFNPLIIVCFPAHATRLRRIPLVHFVHFDTFDFRLVRENRGEAVERPSVQPKIPVPAPVFRLSIIFFTHAFQVTDVDTANLHLNTPFDNMLR
jgi:hypothetical protein